MAEPSALVPVGRMVLKAIVDFLPRVILRRFYPREKLVAHIDVDVRSVSNLEFRLDNIPHAYLWLRITNRSPYVDIQVDHVFVDIWDSQPLVQLSSRKRPVIPRCTTPREAVLCEADLTDGHARRIRERKEISEEFTCYIHAYFESAVGRIERGETIRGVRGRIAG